MQIIDAGLKFKGSLTKRTKTAAVILHHAAGNGSVEAIHNGHIANGWAGIGYNFYIRVDGSIYQGRGWDYVGSHAGSKSGYNAKSVGICFEGDYQERKDMSKAQYAAGVWLVRQALDRYGDIGVIGHRDVTATSCPGQYFPLDKMRDDAKGEDDDMAKVISQIAAAAGMSEYDAILALATLVKFANRDEDQWERDGVKYLLEKGLISSARDGREMVEFGELGTILKRVLEK